jgi:acyl-CoA thioesterase FadM
MLRSEAMHVEGFPIARLATATLPADVPRDLAFAVAHTVDARETSALVPHANNIVILGWIDTLASRHGDAVGAARHELAARGRMWFVARHEIDYLGEAFVGDELLLVTWLESLGRTSLVRQSRIVRADDGRELTRARSRWAHVDLATRRPTAIDEGVRAMLARCIERKTPFDHR